MTPHFNQGAKTEAYSSQRQAKAIKPILGMRIFRSLISDTGNRVGLSAIWATGHQGSNDKDGGPKTSSSNFSHQSAHRNDTV